MESRFEGVRAAEPNDEEHIWQLLLSLHEENGIFAVDEQKVRDTIRYGTGRKGGIIGVIPGSEGIEGSVGMVMDQPWYTSEWCLSERWCFVLPDYRRSTHAKRLIEYAKWCSDQLGIPLQMGIMTTTQTEAKVRLYRRQLDHIGGFFMHRGA